MSGPSREKAERRRLRKGGRFHPDEVFASIPTTYLQAAARTLSPIGFRVFWLANASWRPHPQLSPGGRAVLSYAQIRHPLGRSSGRTRESQPGHSAIADGIREAIASGFVGLAAPGTRPRQSGGARGQAAEFYVPCREAGARLPDSCAHMPRVEGKVRLHAARMRALAATLSGQALRGLGLVVALRDRDRHGALSQPAPFALSATEAARLLDLPRATAAAALKELVERGHLIVEEPSAGRRPATLQLARHFRQFARADHAAKPIDELSPAPQPTDRMPHRPW